MQLTEIAFSTLTAVTVLSVPAYGFTGSSPNCAIPGADGWTCGYISGDTYNASAFQPGTPDFGYLTPLGGAFTSAANTGWLVHRWQSPANAEINVQSTLNLLNIPGLDLGVYINNQLLSEGADLGTGNISINEGGLLVDQGSIIDIAVRATEPTKFGFTSFVDGTTPATLHFLQSREWESTVLTNQITQVPIPTDFPNIIDIDFSSPPSNLVTVPMNVRSGPSINSPVTRQILPGGPPENFSGWTINDFVTVAGVGDDDIWLRLATTNEWISGALFEIGGLNRNPTQPIITKVPTPVTYNFDHVGMALQGQGTRVFEAYRSYTQGKPVENFWDPAAEGPQPILDDAGVQTQHTAASFKHRSPDPTGSPTNYHNEVPIAEGEGKAIEAYLQTVADAGYLDVTRTTNPDCQIITLSILGHEPFPFNECLVSPELQKGRIDGSFTGAGAIERAAEESGLRLGLGNGFVPNSHEVLAIQQIVTQSGSFSIPTTQFSVLSPRLLELFIRGLVPNSDRWVQGWVEAAEFSITASNGLEIGYSEDKGIFNNIPGAHIYQGEFLGFHEPASSPPSTTGGLFSRYSAAGLPISRTSAEMSAEAKRCYENGDDGDPKPKPVQRFFQFIIPNRLPGAYTFKMKGLNENAKAAVGIESGGKLYFPGHGEGCEIEDPLPIPEPSSAISLLLGAGISAKVLKKHKAQAAPSS